MKNFMKKINIIDIGIILILILFIVGLSIRFSGTEAISPVNNTTQLEYTVIIENIRDYTVEALKKSNILTEQKTGAVIGEVLSMETKSYFEEVKGTDGKLYLAEVPNRYSCTLVLKSPVQEISAGKSFKLSTKYAQTTGTIVKVLEIPSENAQ